MLVIVDKCVYELIRVDKNVHESMKFDERTLVIVFASLLTMHKALQDDTNNF